jgi:hypothetical protein
MAGGALLFFGGFFLRPVLGGVGSLGGEEEDVGGFEVAVDNAPLVGVVDGPGQGLQQPGRRAGRPGRALQPVGQAAALDILQGQKGPALVLADFVDLHDVGVAQPGHRLGLGLKPRPLPVAGIGPRPDHLEGHQPVEREVPGLVDDPHPPLAQDA